MMNKKKSWIILLSLPVLLGSCLGKFIESDVEKSIKANEVEIAAYLQQTGETYQKDANGIYFKITQENPGGRVLSEKFDLALNYTLSTLDGKVLDKKVEKDSARFNFYLSQSFEGFIISLIHLKEGERGSFLIPGYMAYQNNPPTGVADWAVIKADIEITKMISEDDKIDEYIYKKKLTINEKTASGLRVSRISATNPTADSVKNGDVVMVKYNGMFLTEKSFDSGEIPVTLGLGSYISGFVEGLKKLKKGEKARFILPSSIGYGEKGSNSIPPYTPLIFDLEILTVNGK
jgi:FKBP-type peptidyl-prolyl cis-trans isomerase